MTESTAQLSCAGPEHVEATDFLVPEAETLDDLRERGWPETLVSKDVVYEEGVQRNITASTPT